MSDKDMSAIISSQSSSGSPSHEVGVFGFGFGRHGATELASLDGGLSVGLEHVKMKDQAFGILPRTGQIDRRRDRASGISWGVHANRGKIISLPSTYIQQPFP